MLQRLRVVFHVNVRKRAENLAQNLIVLKAFLHFLVIRAIFTLLWVAPLESDSKGSLLL